ncbi:hypothetical protein PULV_a2616 [Pseudoalteromonas ulvae UL12]|uniref:hypothetical protein n=1 Tax=Pseudoalteromonas ulvae TaxID=107327 RepID=UPI00186B9EDA|nr:hypothetical protein [Pseudoalteromonas ulvae]MBE0364311.1 hypothetical protein [Pseudoalteromonas ulvae UL12]
MTSLMYAFCISLATVPLPFVGLKLFFPFAILIALTQFKKIPLQRLLVGLVIIFLLTSLSFLFKNEPGKVLIILYCSLSVSLVLFDFTIKTLDWVRVANFHIFAFLVSLISIFLLDFDIVAKFIYGESRHLTGAFEMIRFRGSGVYQEPSTYAYHLLAIVLLIQILEPEEYFYTKLYILFFSLLSFSAAAAVSLIFIGYLMIKSPIKFKLKIAIFTVLIPVVAYVGYIVIEFMLYKINVYAQSGFTDVTRFQAVNLYIETLPLLGLSEIELKQFVVFDLGPLFSSIIMFGVVGLFVVFLFIYSCFKQPLFSTLVVTKIPLTDPLLWMVVKQILTKSDRLK